MHAKAANRKITLLLAAFLFVLTAGLAAQTKPNSAIARKSKVPVRFKLEAGWEFLLPTHFNRDIETASLNVVAGVELFRKIHFAVLGGATLTYAYGTITQWNENFKDVTYSNRAFGAGPVFALHLEPELGKGFSVSGDLGGGIILYSSRFPYGGDIYNFMWRMGGSLIYRVSKSYSLRFSGKWMHVSNGQGLGSFNPSYEAAGTSVQLVKYF